MEFEPVHLKSENRLVILLTTLSNLQNEVKMERAIVAQINRRLSEPRRFIQVVTGPRQVGKTTATRQALAKLAFPSRFVSADEPTLHDGIWLSQQWELARLTARTEGTCILAIDEIQKVSNWSETVKRLWDEDTASNTPIRLLLLGSAQLLLQRGLTESLAGRFEVIRAPHWSFAEMQKAFDWNWEQFVFFGGYPGSADLITDESRWRDYIRHGLVETTITRDILLQSPVHKPALLRRLFEIGCAYSGMELSLTKILGQLQDAGNTVTLAHYLDLFNAAGLITGLQKYADDLARRRNSVPKFQVFNNALTTAIGGRPFSVVRQDPEAWGRIVESSIGTHLINGASEHGFHLHYWRDRNNEVDFVLSGQDRLIAIEVKSGRRKGNLPGLADFTQRFPSARPLLIGADGIPIEQFLQTPIIHWLDQ
jgi:predicted AAA+ superfamily ATPase